MNRYQAAEHLGMTYVTTVAGIPLFSGTATQFKEFHQLIQTPSLV